jgi:murein DD-endopeptidase MepM/ murein hydrolase activator NlpD
MGDSGSRSWRKNGGTLYIFNFITFIGQRVLRTDHRQPTTQRHDPMSKFSQDMRKILFYILVLLSAFGCSRNNKLPLKKFYQFDYPASYSYENDTLKVKLGNPLNCPLRISISSPDKYLSDTLAKSGTLTLRAKSDTMISYSLKSQNKIVVAFNSVYGDLRKERIKGKFSLPFPINRSYKIIQGFNGSHSHSTDFSRYALDFSLKINDTVCSAADGYVVGVIKDYESSGTTEDWTDYANYITIYHPENGLFTQYVHLTKNGSLVKLGDTVLKGQPIGLSGMTGYTTAPHLHFNVLRPDKTGLISTDNFDFDEGYKGAELTENTVVKK